eukprot:TRINITY_DN25101_c0_g1_i1.p1 TRINITY_DN25101_c0_g1~~TRINITY_DN25101_c0_g1_i1.p1  ORF type:complete len:631 (+),score=55.32 TRINITY_DN25101_c0_g1_i1:183-2075(+)
MAGSSATGSFVLLVLSLGLCIWGVSAAHDYGDALSKSFLYYEAQRSGALPPTQRVTWRADSGLNDGKGNGVDLVGGYYDAGDNVKFGLPMAFTVTTLSWSVIEYGKHMARSGELVHAMDAIKWGTDYFIKAHPEPDVLYGEVGDGITDHNCWQRPEDMTTPRQAYRLDSKHPGSDLAGETAAALAAASIVFRQSNPAYSSELLSHSRQLFAFADKYRGKYDSSITVAQKYYASKSGYADELLWAAAWLHEATGEPYYFNYLIDNAGPLGGTGWATTQFSWDVKYAGVQVLASKFLMQRRGGQGMEVLQRYNEKAEYFICASMQKGNVNVRKTPGGLLFQQKWNNMQFVTSAAFLLTVYSDYLTTARKNLQCAKGAAAPAELLATAKSQIDYILGDNPRATSYMVGYGANYPRQVHHRASSIVSYKTDRTFVSCKGGYERWYSSKGSDPNVLVGALVGGPDQNDNFADERDNYEQTEPATYNNGPLVGVLARLQGGLNYQQRLAGGGAVPKPTAAPAISNPSPPARSSTPVKQGNSQFSVSQTMTSSWQSNGRTYHRYSSLVTNTGKQAVKDVKVTVRGLFGPLWGLSKTGDASTYTLPKWRQSLAPGESMEFVYIHAAPEASVSVQASGN